MNEHHRQAAAANLSSKQREASLQQPTLRYGIVSRPRADRSIDLTTAEGQTVQKCVPIYPSVQLDWPAPPVGTVVLWGFADGLASQPFYLGVVRPPDYQPATDGELRLSGANVRLNGTGQATVNGMGIMVVGGQDSDGDTMVSTGQPSQAS